MDNNSRNFKILLIWILILSVIVIFLFMVYLLNSNIFQSTVFADGWGSFIGGVLGGILSAFIAICGVYMTIKSNNENVNAQLKQNKSLIRTQINANKNSLKEQIESNRELMLETLKMQFKPILTFDAITDISILTPQNTIIRDFKSIGNQIINDSWQMASTFENMRNKIHDPWAIVSINNVGNGSALNIEMALEELYEVEGIDSLADISNQIIENFYERCITRNFERTEAGNLINNSWIFYTYFALPPSSTKSFVINFDNCERDIHMIINIKYTDSSSNKYLQKLYVGYVNKIANMLPVSQQITL